MSANLELFAVQAVFHRQLNTERAVRYVITKTGVSQDEALSAVCSVMVAYKQAA
jgi:hypothetical protein